MNQQPSLRALRSASTPLERAKQYIEQGWNPVPIRFREKKPIAEQWQKRVITADNVAQNFNAAQMNIGVQLGVVSGGLVDVDLDCPEAIAIAPYLLPSTRAIFGRP